LNNSKTKTSLDIKVEEVDRKNGFAQRVILRAENYRLSFIIYEGRLFCDLKSRIDGKVVLDEGDLWIPYPLYKKVEEIASAILFSKKKS